MTVPSTPAQVALAAKLRRPLFAHVREVGAGTRDGAALGVYADFQAIGPGPPRGGSFLCLITPLCSCSSGGLYGGAV